MSEEKHNTTLRTSRRWSTWASSNSARWRCSLSTIERERERERSKNDHHPPKSLLTSRERTTSANAPLPLPPNRTGGGRTQAHTRTLFSPLPDPLVEPVAAGQNALSQLTSPPFVRSPPPPPPTTLAALLLSPPSSRSLPSSMPKIAELVRNFRSSDVIP